MAEIRSMSGLKFSALVGCILIGTLVGIAIYHRLHSPRREQWFRDVNQGLDEMFKSNGLVSVGKHGWQLSPDTETNAISSNQTNAAKPTASKK